MLRNVTMFYCTCYMDGNLSECGYQFCVTGYAGIGYAAFRTVSGFKYFLRAYGLSIDKSSVRVIDRRAVGQGRCMVFSFIPRRIYDVYFWHYEELPFDAKPFIGLENGSYVILYAVRGENETKIYRPNPNAKEVYHRLDYMECAKIYG